MGLYGVVGVSVEMEVHLHLEKPSDERMGNAKQGSNMCGALRGDVVCVERYRGWEGEGCTCRIFGLVMLADARQYSVLPREWPPDDESLTLLVWTARRC